MRVTGFALSLSPLPGMLPLVNSHSVLPAPSSHTTAFPRDICRSDEFSDEGISELDDTNTSLDTSWRAADNTAGIGVGVAKDFAGVCSCSLTPALRLPCATTPGLLMFVWRIH